jgi:L-methionine (R)-S-oxide reductase
MTTRTASARYEGTDSRVLSELRNELSKKSIDNGLKSAVKILRKISENYTWLGIYLVKNDSLVLAAYAGEGETEHVQIPIGQGICGLAARQAETIVVPDVNKDPRYLMCFPSTRSEIVVPIRAAAGVLGEIDIDSDRPSAFTRQDQDLLERASTILGEYLQTQRISLGPSKDSR